ncbi:hypothetical protein HYQ46_005769 [Verticillium longisporum]|nr:hypothetical protein HYQ46_005769 [Verticillium longisporum]
MVSLSTQNSHSRRSSSGFSISDKRSSKHVDFRLMHKAMSQMGAQSTLVVVLRLPKLRCHRRNPELSRIALLGLTLTYLDVGVEVRCVHRSDVGEAVVIAITVQLCLDEVLSSK